MAASPAVHHTSILLGRQNRHGRASKSRSASLSGGLCAGHGYRDTALSGSVVTEGMLKGFSVINWVP